MTKRMYEVGKVVNTHGIRGEVRVIPSTDFPERFHVGNQLYLVKKNHAPISLTIEKSRSHKQFQLLKFEGYETIEDVEPFKGATLKITEDQRTKLPEGEYYIQDIVDCRMFTLDGEEIGTITSIMKTGANDVWVVEQTDGKEILIPYIDDVVKKVNLKEKKVYIHVMEGLLE